ncbi:PREDICTED: peptidoglycan-recognition protein SC2-like [Nicrophorus vespilloides]|uniref:Peptidoglycan-recognition protein n=1 Tax=Nicrophorus vespilloides TaxID=110193 RepID=A0ABM1NGJ7_NICVS|nr:PREDICTED: peptidoglycan-recognition protein SC2-like [Nicrophorus vespilloides]
MASVKNVVFLVGVLLFVVGANCSPFKLKKLFKDGDLDIVSRKEWKARTPENPPIALTEEPVPYVVIHHSATPSCTTKAKCKGAVKGFQNYHIDQNEWNDIGYNFIIGEDGNIYEGRGWGVTGAHAPPLNDKSIGICIIGTFIDTLPNEKALHALRDLIAEGMKTNRISRSYGLVGHRQTSATECPGKTFYNEIKTWARWIEHPPIKES